MIDFKTTTIKELHENLNTGKVSITDVQHTVNENITSKNIKN